MTIFIIRRILQAAVVTLITLSVVFVVGRVVGDPVRIVIGIEAEEVRVQQVRDQLGLNDPLSVQYWKFMTGALRGEMGISFWTRTPTMPMVLERLPATLYLGVVTALLAFPLAILLGAIAALKPHSWADRLINVTALGGVSIVEFWLALMLILVVAVQIGWFKTSGYGGAEYVILPALTLAYKPIGRISQMARSAIIDELRKPYIKAARAKGLSEKQVVFTHALKNAAIPIITTTGDEVATILNGAMVVETVFGWPGVGLLTINALSRRDLPLVEATVFVVTGMIIITNMLLDVAYTYLNPRIRFQ